MSSGAESTFYAALSPHYDGLFRCSDSLVELIVDLVRPTSRSEEGRRVESGQADAPPKVLDVACGTGGCTRALVSRGVDAVGVDLSQRMIRRARELAAGRDVDPERFSVGDMLEVDAHPHAPVDLLFSVGNSISHLTSVAAVERFLAAAARALGARPAVARQTAEESRSGTGALVLQYVAAETIEPGTTHRLPDLEAPGVRMERRYHREDADTIRFDAALVVDAQEPVRLSQRLLVIGDEELEEALVRAGYRGVERYGGFDRSPAGPGVGARVVLARRP
ncbi:MAG: class I SAM-dependent methyltransferase [Spirochaetota bacterium]